ncbi:hypothetical protein G9P44_004961 [Scheffersomyces stipitis]|nr:hypothetical protein G9P44_004961 [Scheffersomyces stipitis]
MFPHKKNDPLKSLPISRVGSSQRLNQHISSIPSTPNYVASSLNPVRNLPVSSGSIKSKITTKAALDKFEQLPIVKQVGAFEDTLNAISDNISQFKEGELHANVEKIIAINDDLKSKIEELDRHRRLGENIKELEAESSNLDNTSKYILKELISYRNELRALPRLPASASKRAAVLGGKGSGDTVEIEDILKYAMKLAKFTKAPATSASMPFQIHPNNYVWPAEDALRRGMLAASSLNPDEIIANELGTTEEEKIQEKKDEQVKKADKQQDTGIRRGSFGDYGSSSSGKKKEEQSAQLDLDLFDSEDEFSD